MNAASDLDCGSGLCGISTLQRSLRCKRQFSDVGLHILDYTSLPSRTSLHPLHKHHAWHDPLPTHPCNTASRPIALCVKQFGVAAFVLVASMLALLATSTFQSAGAFTRSDLSKTADIR